MLELQKAENRWGGAKGTWFPITMNGKKTAIVNCPSCGEPEYLDHEISDDGTVIPSLECPLAPCTFHDWVKLVGWEKEVKSE